jgi:acyl-CoA synthetase (AMP-forming)/AMP-acid ligase II
MAIEFLLERFRRHAGDEAIVYRDRSLTFQDLLDGIAQARADHAAHGIGPGSVVALEADFSPQGIAHLLGLLGSGAVVVPLAPTSLTRHEEFRRIAQVSHRIAIDADDNVAHVATGASPAHPLYDLLRASAHPGLLLFTSGSSGEPKAALHDGVRLLAKYATPRQRLRTLLFLLFDHIGGFDTLLQALSNVSTVIVPGERTPEGIARAIARHRAEVLPASPSFLGLLLLSGAPARHDLGSLRYITYGAEVMPQTTLARLHAAFPQVRLLQKYGLTEVGTLRSSSPTDDSLWVRIGGEGFATRVRDGLLEIRADSSMLGYLNAASPFTDEGWFMTGDAVEQEGETFRILGRASDMINVGGRKVHPAEVEAVIAEVDHVIEVSVHGEPHPFTGAIVVARVALDRDEDPRALEQRVREHCRARLAPYMVPARVEIATTGMVTERDKKVRRADAS